MDMIFSIKDAEVTLFENTEKSSKEKSFFSFYRWTSQITWDIHFI